jgi:hypothetical protein
MPKPLYDSPDISLVDYTNTSNRSGGPRPYSIDERILAPKATQDNNAQRVLEGLKGLPSVRNISDEGDVEMRDSALMYLEKNIPDVGMYLKGLSENATTEEKIAAIVKGLEEKSQEIEDYNNREIEDAPFLGNEVEEARGKQEGPDISLRYKSQYEMIPGVKGRDNRGTVKSYKVQRNPKTKLTRIKFL